ncbi:Uncharacterised protein r2_g3019 [Pycnogonum litorale]
MRHIPDNKYMYICHVMDHFSKFHVLFPLETKSANEVATMFEQRVLAYLGAPRIFHSDNGREFVNQVMVSLMKIWKSDIVFVHGRPRHSQSQGLIERGNRVVEDMLTKMQKDSDGTSFPWASWLPQVMYILNTLQSETTKKTPYEIVFGQNPRGNIFPGQPSRIYNEEDLSDDIININVLKENDNSTNSMSSIGENFRKNTNTTVTDDSNQITCSIDVESEDINSGIIIEDACEEPSHKIIRTEALAATKKSTQRMQEMYKKKHGCNIKIFNLNDFVTVNIPNADRSTCEAKRLPCQVVGMSREKNVYQLCSEYGMLAGRYRGTDLEAYHGNVKVVVESKVISLRTAARFMAPNTKFLLKKCSCKSKCENNRCICRKNK